MVIRKVMGLLCLIITSIFVTAQDSTLVEKLSLQQAVELGIKNNLEVQQSDVAMQRAKVGLNTAKGSILPSISANVNHGIQQGRSINPFTNSYINQSLNNADYSLNGSLVLFRGLLIQNNIKLNKFAYEASRLEYQQMKDNLTLNIILTYLQILTNEDQLKQALVQADITRQQVSRLEVMDKDGAIAPNLLYDLKGQLASDELSAVNNRNAVATSKLTLAQLMNVPYSAKLQVERLNPEQMPMQYNGDVDAIYQVALTELAMVKAAVLRTKSAEKAVQVARGDLYPVVSLNGGLSTNYSSVATTQRFVNFSMDSVGYVKGTNAPVLFRRDNFDADKIGYYDQFKNNYGTGFGIGLRVPLLNGLQTRNRVAAAKLDKKNTELIEENTRIQLKQAIEQAYFNMTAAHDRYEATQKQVDAFRESFKAAEVKFNAGAINSVEYLNSKNFLDRANVSMIIARYDFVLRTKILDYYQAKPLW